MWLYPALRVCEDKKTVFFFPRAARYWQGARKWHPDLNSSPEATQKFLRISEAYVTLADPAKRKAYDESRETASADCAKNFLTRCVVLEHVRHFLTLYRVGKTFLPRVLRPSLHLRIWVAGLGGPARHAEFNGPQVRQSMGSSSGPFDVSGLNAMLQFSAALFLWCMPGLRCKGVV